MPDAIPLVDFARLDAVFDRMLKKHPESKNVIEMFHLVARTFAVLPAAKGLSLPPLEEDLFVQGKPWHPKDSWDPKALRLAEGLCALEGELSRVFAANLDDLKKLKELLQKDPALVEKLAGQALAGETKALSAFADKQKISPDFVSFILNNLVQQRARELAQAAAPVLRNHQWNQGFCPLCGSAPKFSYLAGEGGARHLICSLCETEWRYSRTTCPYCSKEEADNLTLHFLENAQDERAESCRNCKRYILSADLRHRPEDIPLAAMLPFGLVHMDLLMSKKDYILGCYG